ncbi:MAG: rod shape-determining protein MreD [Solirubrobacteraceae bacterium]|nr:rod shape-determining protein MreD [Solirubrobacteraceae bacterium]
MSAASRVLRAPRGRGAEESQLAWRLVLVGAAAVLIQNAFFSDLRLFDGRVDILPLVALAAGFLAGPTGGAATGFGMGLLSDLILGVPLGVTSLILLVVGDIGGRVGNARDPEGFFVPMLTGAVVTFSALIATGVFQVLLGAPSAASWELLQATITTTLLNGLIAPFVYRATRRGLIGALARDPRQRRRRATTTRLSPLSTSRGQSLHRGRSVSGNRASRALSGGTRRRSSRVGGRR